MNLVNETRDILTRAKKNTLYGFSIFFNRLCDYRLVLRMRIIEVLIIGKIRLIKAAIKRDNESGRVKNIVKSP